MKQLGYQQTMDMRVVRTRHRVTFRNFTKAGELKEFLTYVPNDATFDSFESGHDDDDDFYIEFAHEVPETVEDQGKNDD